MESSSARNLPSPFPLPPKMQVSLDIYSHCLSLRGINILRRPKKFKSLEEKCFEASPLPPRLATTKVYVSALLSASPSPSWKAVLNKKTNLRFINQTQYYNTIATVVLLLVQEWGTIYSFIPIMVAVTF